tara:strand:- start:2615 stop:3718 length:1104 start_codon:yes stop_codon:yes gene_type:complete
MIGGWVFGSPAGVDVATVMKAHIPWKCPEGAVINKMNGTKGEYINSVQAQCTDSTLSPVYGNPEGEAWEFESTTGGFSDMTGVGNNTGLIGWKDVQERGGVKLPDVLGTATPDDNASYTRKANCSRNGERDVAFGSMTPLYYNGKWIQGIRIDCTNFDNIAEVQEMLNLLKEGKEEERNRALAKEDAAKAVIKSAQDAADLAEIQASEKLVADAATIAEVKRLKDLAAEISAQSARELVNSAAEEAEKNAGLAVQAREAAAAAEVLAAKSTADDAVKIRAESQELTYLAEDLEAEQEMLNGSVNDKDDEAAVLEAVAARRAAAAAKTNPLIYVLVIIFLIIVGIAAAMLMRSQRGPTQQSQYPQFRQ